MLDLPSRLHIGLLTAYCGIAISTAATEGSLDRDYSLKNWHAWSFPDESWFDPSWNNELPEYWKVGDKYYKIRDLMGRRI